MKKAVLRALSASLLMAFSTIWAAGPPVAADTYTVSSAGTSNFGGLANLLVNSTSSSYVRFDLSSYTTRTGADVAKAYIAGYERQVTTGGAIKICDSSGPWVESTL